MILSQLLQSVSIRSQGDDVLSNLRRQFIYHVVHHGHWSVVNDAPVTHLEQHHFDKRTAAKQNSLLQSVSI